MPPTSSNEPTTKTTMITTAAPVCVVTGGSNGIGLATVKALFSYGMIVWNFDVVPPPPNTIITAEEEKDKTCCGSLFNYHKVNVANSKEFTLGLQKVYDTHKRLDCLVNNAGVYECIDNHNILWDDTTTTEQIDTILQTNLGSVVHGTRAAYQLMRKCSSSCTDDSSGANTSYNSSTNRSSSSSNNNDNNNSNIAKATTTLTRPSEAEKATTTTKSPTPCSITRCIVNIASMGAFHRTPQRAVYGSTKAAIVHFSQSADMDLRKDNIRVFCICPGIVDTAMGRMGGERNRQAVAKLKDGKRTSPSLVAEAVVGLVVVEPSQSHRERHDNRNKKWQQEGSYLSVSNHEIQCHPIEYS